MCEDTGISYEEPSPNAFSFNSPYGACPVCKGLGNVYQVNMEAIIPDKTLSINEGAYCPAWEKKEMLMFLNRCSNFAKKYKISLDKPVKDIPENALNLFYLEMKINNETVMRPNWIP